MTGLEGLIDNARGCAHMFRLGRDVEAGLAMVTLVEAAQPFIAGLPGDVQAPWSQLLASMLKDQEGQNWLSLADYLEYELVDLLAARLTV